MTIETAGAGFKRLELDVDALDDELLAIRCQLGETAALEVLVDRWHPAMWRYARRMLGDDGAASEALQDAWLRILRALPQLRDPARLRAWLFAIVRRVLMDRLRAEYAEPPMSADELHGITAPDADDLTDRDLVWRGLELLPPAERDVLVLVYLEDLALAQVAEVLGIPVGTVKSRVFRARKSLHQKLTELGVRK